VAKKRKGRGDPLRVGVIMVDRGGGIVGAPGLSIARMIEETELVKKGAWYRIAQRHTAIDPADTGGPRDGIVSGLPEGTLRDARDVAIIRDLILLICVDEHDGRLVNLAMDREGCRDLVNILMEAVAESERRAPTLAVKDA